MVFGPVRGLFPAVLGQGLLNCRPNTGMTPTPRGGERRGDAALWTRERVWVRGPDARVGTAAEGPQSFPNPAGLKHTLMFESSRNTLPRRDRPRTDLEECEMLK